MSTRIGRFLRFVIAVSFATLAACGRSENEADTTARATGQNEATVLLESGSIGTWPTGLDPATNTTGGLNLSLMNAIFGGLFQLTADADGGNSRISGILASGYEIADDGLSVLIRIRPGTVFSDGTPFDAEAVAFSFERNISTPCSCAPTRWPWDALEPVRVVDGLTVMLRFTQPFAAVMNALPVSNLNWVVSPTALRTLGEDQFKITPVGAGPFKVVSNELSFRVELEANPLYWEEDRPHLDRLVFQSIGSEQAALHALLAGDAQALEGSVSNRVIEQAQHDERVVVTMQPSTSVYMIQLNTRTPPFDDLRAREALYYATDVDAIRRGLFDDWYPASQSFSAPGSLFHHAEIPGYRSFDLERARSIVTELGGISVTLGTIQSFVAEQVVTALQSQWQDAGIDVTIELYEFGRLIQEYESDTWQAMLQVGGSYDPEAGSGVRFRYSSGQLYSGVQDERLDAMLDAAAKTLDVATRDRLYFEMARYISDQAYSPFLFAFSPAQITSGGLSGPGLTTKIPPLLINPGILWQDVRIAAE